MKESIIRKHKSSMKNQTQEVKYLNGYDMYGEQMTESLNKY